MASYGTGSCGSGTPAAAKSSPHITAHAAIVAVIDRRGKRMGLDSMTFSWCSCDAGSSIEAVFETRCRIDVRTRRMPLAIRHDAVSFSAHTKEGGLCMRKMALIVAALGIAAVSSAFADEAKYGGQVKKIGAYEGELVVKGADVQLYVIKDHKPFAPPAGMTASVRLFVGNAESTVDLAPAGDKLAGKASAPATGSVRAMATLTEAGKEVGKAQYTVTAK